MANAHLINQKLQEVHFHNKLDGSGQVQLKSGFNVNVNFTKEGNRCIARLYQSLKGGEDEKLFLSVDVVGVFDCEGIVTDDDKKEIHIQCYDQLFPYVQSTFSTLLSSSGINGFQLRKAQMTPDKIQTGQNPGFPTQQPPKQTLPIV